MGKYVFLLFLLIACFIFGYISGKADDYVLLKQANTTIRTLKSINHQNNRRYETNLELMRKELKKKSDRLPCDWEVLNYKGVN